MRISQSEVSDYTDSLSTFIHFRMNKKDCQKALVAILYRSLISQTLLSMFVEFLLHRQQISYVSALLNKYILFIFYVLLYLRYHEFVGDEKGS